MKIKNLMRTIITIIGFMLDMVGILDSRLGIAIVGGLIGLIDISTFIWLYKTRTMKEVLEEMYL